MDVFGPLIEQGRNDGECSFACSAEIMALFLHHLDSGMTGRLKSIVTKADENAVYELSDLINGFTFTISKLIGMDREKAAEMILSDKMIEVYTSIIENNREKAGKGKHPEIK